MEAGDVFNDGPCVAWPLKESGNRLRFIGAYELGLFVERLHTLALLREPGTHRLPVLLPHLVNLTVGGYQLGDLLLNIARPTPDPNAFLSWVLPSQFDPGNLGIAHPGSG